ncbi:MAG: trimethylamine methyltransferase family protein [Desulfobacterales bacterium]|nr:trimethylamine methyltransferase family protein [Desulfobacterales bacterium]
MKDALNIIHNASMEILETCGIKFGSPRIVMRFKENGCRTKGDIVYFKREQLMEWVGTAPASFILHARNPEHDMVLGGDTSYYAPGYGAPAVIDPDGSKRPATFNDYYRFVKLVQACEHFHINGGILVQPSDLDADTAFASMLHAAMVLSDKCLIAGGGRAGENEMVLEMISILAGGRERLAEKPRIIALVNTTSPLMMDSHSLDTLETYALAGQPVMITPATMAGTTGPVTLAGTIAMANAESLAGIALTQLIRPGTPAVYGFQCDTADMRFGSIGRGSAEGALCFTYGAALAKHYGLPCRGGGSVTCAKSVSAQAGYEGMMTLMASRQARMNLMIHSAGMMDADAAMSYEKFICDLEIIGMVERFARGVEVSEDSLALEVIKAVGPAGEFLTHTHTMAHCRNESWVPGIGLRGHMGTDDPDGTFADNISKRLASMIDSREVPELSGTAREELDRFAAAKGIPTFNG